MTGLFGVTDFLSFMEFMSIPLMVIFAGLCMVAVGSTQGMREFLLVITIMWVVGAIWVAVPALITALAIVGAIVIAFLEWKRDVT